MTRSDWIAVIAIVVGALMSSIQILLQWISMRNAPTPAANQNKPRAIPKIKFQWRIPKWVLHVAIFIVQTAAIYFLLEEYRSTEPLTRSSVVLIASMVGLVSICFVLPLILGVYKYIEAYFG
jgi:hypothetical protein